MNAGPAAARIYGFVLIVDTQHYYATIRALQRMGTRQKEPECHANTMRAVFISISRYGWLCR